MTLLLLFLLQDRIELKDHGSSYLLQKPPAYSEARSWPLILDVSGGRAEEAMERWTSGGGKAGHLILVPVRTKMGKERDAAFVRACLTDVKSKLRVDPERVLLTGLGAGADFAASLCASDPELFAGCAPLGLTAGLEVKGKLPPFHVVTQKGDARGRALVSALVGAGVDVFARVFEAGQADEPKVLEWFAAKASPRGDLETADRFFEAQRYLDATLVCLGLLERKEEERGVRSELRKLEAAGIMALGSVEVAVGKGKYLDAWLRCREAAAQFSWLPVGEKLRKRLEALESDERVKKARASED